MMVCGLFLMVLLLTNVLTMGFVVVSKSRSLLGQKLSNPPLPAGIPATRTERSGQGCILSLSSEGSNDSDGSNTESTTTQKNQESNKEVEGFLQKNYPSFYTLLMKNDEIRSLLEKEESEPISLTLFVPSETVFEGLDDKKQTQLEDPRNLETAQKMAAYHVIPNELVLPSQIFREDWTVPKTKSGKPELTFRGVQTLGGEVPVGRKKNPTGFLGLLDEEDPKGTIVVGPEAIVVKSFKVGGKSSDEGSSSTAIIHETNDFVSPVILWRYFDQLRFPGL